MRIAFIIGTFPTISETFILNQITGLIDRGHAVDIFAQSQGDINPLHGDVVKYGLLEKAYYLRPVPESYVVRAVKGIRILVSYGHKKPECILSSLNVFKYGRKAASLRMLYAVASYIGSEPYDIIHCHFGPNGLLGARLRDVGVLNGRLVTAFHGYDITRYVDSNGSHIYNSLFEQGDFFLPIRERWKDTLVRLGCNENKIAVHHMGVDCSRLVFRTVRPESDTPVRILTIARLVEKKGVEYGIRAVAKISSKYHNIEYNIIGDGPLRNHCACIIEELNAADKIHLLGWKNQKEVDGMLNISHIFLGPSVTSAKGDKEGIPVALMEAMATGLPVVSTRHSGIPELVQDGISGFLVPEKDVDALAERLLYLIEHPEIWPKMGSAGRAYVEANYDINKLNDRLVEIYGQLLKDSKVNLR